ncbi:hypothetical protein TELCIR_07521, partial [Teladorsagia circumcincta]
PDVNILAVEDQYEMFMNATFEVCKRMFTSTHSDCSEYVLVERSDLVITANSSGDLLSPLNDVIRLPMKTRRHHPQLTTLLVKVNRAMTAQVRRDSFKTFWDKYSDKPDTNSMMLNQTAHDLEASDRADILSSLPHLTNKDVVDIGAGIGVRCPGQNNVATADKDSGPYDC